MIRVNKDFVTLLWDWLTTYSYYLNKNKNELIIYLYIEFRIMKHLNNKINTFQLKSIFLFKIQLIIILESISALRNNNLFLIIKFTNSPSRIN